MHENSKSIGAILGPSLVAMIASEFPLVQPTLYDEQIPPVVYLSGTLMFIFGLAMIRAHNYWAWNWAVLITVVSWFLVLLGLARMFLATAYVEQSASTSSTTFIAIELAILVVGLIISDPAP